MFFSNFFSRHIRPSTSMSKRVGGPRLCQLRLVPVPLSRPEPSAALPARAEPPTVSVVDHDDEVQVLAVTTTNAAAPASFSFSDAFKYCFVLLKSMFGSRLFDLYCMFADQMCSKQSLWRSQCSRLHNVDQSK
jgi:hypothetical protein